MKSIYFLPTWLHYQKSVLEVVIIFNYESKYKLFFKVTFTVMRNKTWTIYYGSENSINGLVKLRVRTINNCFILIHSYKRFLFQINSFF